MNKLYNQTMINLATNERVQGRAVVQAGCIETLIRDQKGRGYDVTVTRGEGTVLMTCPALDKAILWTPYVSPF